MIHEPSDEILDEVQHLLDDELISAEIGAMLNQYLVRRRKQHDSHAPEHIGIIIVITGEPH